jgi:hypothetical protein
MNKIKMNEKKAKRGGEKPTAFCIDCRKIKPINIQKTVVRGKELFKIGQCSSCFSKVVVINIIKS